MKFPLVELSELLEPASRWFAPDSFTVYRQLGVRLWGHGAYEREQILGADTKYGKLNVCKKDDIVVNKIWARNGSIAVVPQELDGTVVSNEFPIFTVKKELLNPQWFRLFTKTPILWSQCANLARGTSGQNRIKPEKFLSVRIPLPGLNLQREIVGRVDSISSKLENAQLLMSQLQADTNSFAMAIANEFEMFSALPSMLGDVSPLDRRIAEISSDLQYKEIACRSFGKGVFEKPSFQGSDLTWQRPNVVKAGDVLLSNIKAWEGAIAVVPPEHDGKVVSHRYLTLDCDRSKIIPEFLCFYLLSREGLEHIGSASPGTADRNRTLNVKKLHQIPVPIPPMEHQLKLKRILDAKAAYLAQDTFEKDAESLRRSILAKAFRGEL